MTDLRPETLKPLHFERLHEGSFPRKFAQPGRPPFRSLQRLPILIVRSKCTSRSANFTSTCRYNWRTFTLSIFASLSGHDEQIQKPRRRSHLIGSGIPTRYLERNTARPCCDRRTRLSYADLPLQTSLPFDHTTS